MAEIKNILRNGNHILFDKSNMISKSFKSDFRQVRFFTMLLLQKIPSMNIELSLLGQQISELISNAIKHGNKKDCSKMINVWYNFNEEYVHLIIEDQGDGFKDIKKWNEFNKKRIDCLKRNKYSDLEKFISYRTSDSTGNDGGVALFAAVEYWNAGMVYNEKGNSVAVKRVFTKKRKGIELK